LLKIFFFLLKKKQKNEAKYQDKLINKYTNMEIGSNNNNLNINSRKVFSDVSNRTPSPSYFPHEKNK
jgi:hypothetical protein